MEGEVNLLKKKMEECKMRSRSLRETNRVQRDKSRQIIVACASKLQEKEAVIEQMKVEHDATLSYIARELAFLHANMLKEQQRLEALVSDKSRTVETLVAENDRLRKLNKKLNKQQASQISSSEDSSPKSSFSTKVEVKRHPANALSPGPKPPVPSRAGINRLLQSSGSAPPIPVRSTSLNTSHLERVDSGRESDLTSDVEHCQSKPKSCSPQGGPSGGQDEGFCSSHEDNNASAHRQLQMPRQSLANHHRDVQKPSDIKQRYKAKMASTSNLAVLQEHQVTASSDGGVAGNSSGGVTTVTYWTGSFL